MARSEWRPVDPGRTRAAADARREQLEADTQAFLAKGGKVRPIPTGVSGDPKHPGGKAFARARRHGREVINGR